MILLSHINIAQQCQVRYCYRIAFCLSVCHILVLCSNDSTIILQSVLCGNIGTVLPKLSVKLKTDAIGNKSSAAAEMGDRGHNRHRPKRGGGCYAPFAESWDPV